MNDRLAKQRAAQATKGIVTRTPQPKKPSGAQPYAPGKSRGQKKAKFTQERLPDLSAFEATWSAEKVEWSGSLHVTHNGQAKSFLATSKTLFTLVSMLDRLFRAWAKEVPK